MVRHWMKAPTRDFPGADSRAYRIAVVDDAVRLGPLMDRAYTGTIDWERETPAECVAEMRGTLTGKYGPFFDFASFVIEEGGRIVATSLVTYWREKPLLAFSMTDPDYQGSGYGKYLIERSISALHARGYPAIYLAVTEGNTPAQKLYARLGFTVENST